MSEFNRQAVEAIWREQIAKGVPLDFGDDRRSISVVTIFDAGTREKYDSPDWANEVSETARTTMKKDYVFVSQVIQESGGGTEARARVLEEQSRREALQPR